MTVGEQAGVWMEQLRARNRRPLKTSTLNTYRYLLNTWVLPGRYGLQNLELSQVNNRVLKDLVAEMRKRGRSPVTVGIVIQIVRDIVRSDRDPETGTARVKLDFDADFVDLPVVDRRKQKAPTTTQKAIQEAISGAWDHRRQYSLLYALLGATGLRISEALAIRVGRMETVTFWDPAECLIRVQTQLYRGQDGPPKSASGYRDVDLPEALNAWLVQGSLDVGRKHKQMLFSETLTYAREELGLTGIQGFHAFRRFRATHLRMTQAPEDLIRYWLGHSSNQITDRYSKLAERVDVRREWVEKVGLGFELEAKCLDG